MSVILAAKTQSTWDHLVHKGGLIGSSILTIFLSAIGYPKQIILFIIFLIIVDVLTRWIAEIVKHYGSFTALNFFRAWRDKVLNSKKLKAGLFIKIFFYGVLLVVAHQSITIPELTFGKFIGNFIYSIMVILDLISICENGIDAGFDRLKPILNFFNKKKDELVSTDVTTESQNNNDVNDI